MEAKQLVSNLELPILSMGHKLALTALAETSLKVFPDCDDRKFDYIVYRFRNDFGYKEYKSWPVNDMEMVKEYGS